MVLGPGCNIKRNPLGGRNFEYISEDPYQAGKMAAAFIRGQQGTGALSSLKHFAANSQEYKRMNGDSQMDERTLREIYLAAFETAVKEGHPATVMCSYNKINGEHCSDSKTLLTDILRTDWGFDGMVVTDWGAMNDRIRGFQAGCDLNMPGGSDYMHLLDKKQTDYAEKRLVKAMENYSWRLGTGFLSTPFILDVLASLDMEYAYRLLENEEMPGWLFMPKNGATTIWESWEGTQAQDGIASLNHYSKGAACEWLFKTMCGIRVEAENHFTIAPRPGGHFTYAKASYDSVYGRVESGWKKRMESGTSILSFLPTARQKSYCPKPLPKPYLRDYTILNDDGKGSL